MYLIYSKPGSPAALLVCRYLLNGESRYRVVNGGYDLVEVSEGSYEHLRLSDKYERWNNDEGRATVPKGHSDTEPVAALAMEWGPSMCPADAAVRELLPPGEVWDYNTVLNVARQLVTSDVLPMAWRERELLDAQQRNPEPPTGLPLLTTRPGLLQRQWARIRGIP